MEDNKISPTLLMVGTGSLLNYGCEAIVQGTYNILQSYWPGSQLVVASDDLAYDRTIFSEYEHIQFISYKKRFTFYRLLMGVLRRIGIGKGSSVRMNHKIIDNYDILLSSGGDNFAQAPDGSLYYILQDLIKTGERAKKIGKFYALWGASVGPFDGKNEALIAKHLKKADILFPREDLSHNYLQKLGITQEANIKIADPAFWMEPDHNTRKIDKKDGELVIGLNISPLSINHIFEDKERGKNNLFSILDSVLQENSSFKFLCIPHVGTDKGGPQDDFSFMQDYYAFSKFKNRVDIIEFGLGARKTKSIISQCDMLIASRMHCCIAGISSATPTLFLTYSQKGVGVAQYAYGESDMILPLKNMSKENLNDKVREVSMSLNRYREYLLSQQDRFKSDASLGVLNIKKVFSKNN